jgi:hypothetical protein
MLMVVVGRATVEAANAGVTGWRTCHGRKVVLSGVMRRGGGGVGIVSVLAWSRSEGVCVGKRARSPGHEVR